MPTTWRSIAGLSLAAVLLAACSGSAASTSPEPAAPADAQFLLRVTTVQALPPDATFSSTPQIVITLDGVVLQGGAVPAIFPGPLMQPISAWKLTPGGWAAIVDAARRQGVLNGANDFTGGQMPPGSTTTRLQIVADGRMYDLRGDAQRAVQCVTTPCAPAPGTPEAFAGFIGALMDPTIITGPVGRGPDLQFIPDRYAVLVGPVPDDQGLVQPPMAWPLAAGFASFGKPLANGSGGRCGIVSGADAATVRGPFSAANQLTKWRDPVDASFHGLTVRPLLPGDEDPCAGMV